MHKRELFYLFVFLFLVSGCARLSKKDLEIQQLRGQISDLEMQLRQKDQEIEEMKIMLDRERYTRAKTRERVSYETKQRPTIRQIQIALRNAGFDPGQIDGKMGAKTRQAIKAFQKANGLNPDGKVGKQTWNLLRKYLR